MPDVIIENPVINSPFEEPRRHFRFTEDGITDEVVEGRRMSEYFVPIPRSKKKSPKQMSFETEWTSDRLEENKTINRIRERVGLWRKGGYKGITPVTARLLEYWQRPGRERRLFFAQIEALETAIYLTEVAGKVGDAWIENYIRDENARANPLLYRIAFKMATGSGKTLVMAMLIAWQALNKLANTQDARFSDTFLIVAPGITIKDRLRVLMPNDPQNYYRQHDLVPVEMLTELGKAKMVITNFHAFKLREKVAAGKLTKDILKQGETSPFTETPDQMARRVCRALGNKKNIVVLNDEAHHCYRRKVDEDDEKLTGDERKEAQQREEEARVWISGLEAVKAKLGVKVVYDLSATPFFLRGSGYSEGTLFPWVVSDFSLIDAIESGIVKVPRVPVADDSMTGEQPTYRDLWLRIRDGLPKKGRKADDAAGEPTLPVELEGALQSLYNNYERYFERWENNTLARENGLTPPVFIVVCNNTNVSKLVFDYISGWEKPLPDGSTVLVPGKLPLFSNVDNGRWSARPNTILIDSQQLESGEGMTPEFKKIAATEIDEFKADYQARFPGRDIDNLTDEDILREVMNTVGKPGRLGESVKCVVSVSMLTEGWDCLDESTEILTINGWAGMGQVSPGDLIYSLNRETGQMDIVPILEYGERRIRDNERMVRLKSQHLDIRVTEGHEFHLKYRNPRTGGALSKGWITKKAHEMVSRRSSYALPLAAEYPDFPGIPLTDDEIRLVAWFMTDGGFSGYKLAISQSKPFHNDIRDLLARLDLDYTEGIVEPGIQAYENARPMHVFRIPKGTHSGSLERNGWSKYSQYLDKAVAPVLHQMTKQQFLVFWDELLKGDGEKQGNKSGWLWCSEKAQADAYTQMAVLRGLAASYHPEITDSGMTVYRVTVRDAQWITSDPGDDRATKIAFDEPAPNETVWCVRNQNSTLVTRRNGKPAIIGNCNTVTHILGVRAFGTQLLCEQVVGRGLRRMSYAANEQGMFEPEYAEVYGVPFSFIPSAGSAKDPKPGPTPTRVRALPERIACEISFPRIIGYRYHFEEERLTANFTDDSKMALSTADLPTRTEVASILGESNVHELYGLKDMRLNQIDFKLAALVLEKYFKDNDGNPRPWLFPQLLKIAREWRETCLTYKDDTFPQMLLLVGFAHEAAQKIYQAIVASNSETKTLLPIPRPYDATGSTRYVDFDTARDVYRTDPNKCHVSHVVLDSGWEAKMAESLEEMPEVLRYAKNYQLGFNIPYTLNGEEKQYVPDYLIHADTGDGREPLNLIVEVSGEARKDKAAKVAAARNLWIPAVNNHGGWGRWAFIEIVDPWDAKNTIRAFLQGQNLDGVAPMFQK